MPASQLLYELQEIWGHPPDDEAQIEELLRQYSQEIISEIQHLPIANPSWVSSKQLVEKNMVEDIIRELGGL